MQPLAYSIRHRYAPFITDGILQTSPQLAGALYQDSSGDIRSVTRSKRTNSPLTGPFNLHDPINRVRNIHDLRNFQPVPKLQVVKVSVDIRLVKHINQRIPDGVCKRSSGNGKLSSSSKSLRIQIG